MPTSRWQPPRLSLAFALATLAPLALLFHPPAVHASFLAADPTYLGYRIPEHRWSNWTASVNAAGGHSFSPTFGGETRRRVINGNLGTRATFGYDSDPLQHQWGFSVSAGGGRSSQDLTGDSPLLTFEQNTRDRSLSRDFRLDGSLRTYPWSVPLGLTLRTDHTFRLRQSFSSNAGREVDPVATRLSTQSTGRGARDYVGTVGAGVGFGRVRDATPVYQAQVLEARLRGTGALSRELSEVARRRLAALFTLEFAIANAHQRSTKYLWREIENVLREDGALSPGSLDAYDVFRLMEPIVVAGKVTRRVGSFIGPALVVSTLRTRNTFESAFATRLIVADTVFATNGDSFSRTDNFRDDQVFTSLVAEFHRPLSERWQVDASSVAAISEAGDDASTASSVSVTWLVSDRWLGALRFTHSGTSLGRGPDRRLANWNVGLAGDLFYFLEDAWALRLTATEGQAHTPSFFERSGGFQLGVTYVVSGLFEAPGLVEAMRPSPPRP